MSRRLTTFLALILVALAVAATGCGSSSSSSSGAGGSAAQTSPQHVHFAKTKFLIHAGLAFGAFHRYIYKPFRAGGFTPPTRHKAALVKAGLAALFAYHEAKIALTDAQSSPLLSKLVSPLTALQGQLRQLGARLHGGQGDPAGIAAANSNVTAIGQQSARNGLSIRDQPTPSLGG